jgi:hypothetical protein
MRNEYNRSIRGLAIILVFTFTKLIIKDTTNLGYSPAKREASNKIKGDIL